jgi:hypothetical protein
MAKAKEKAPPKGAKLGDYNGKPTMVYGDEEKAPSHGVGKAKGICAMDKAGLKPEEIQAICGNLGLYNLKKVDGKLLVAGSKFLVDHVAAVAKAAKAAA